eukprot:COSAG01_NODE_1784_length_9237_cov_11.706829_1_plen_86_part_00
MRPATSATISGGDSLTALRCVSAAVRRLQLLYEYSTPGVSSLLHGVSHCWICLSHAARAPSGDQGWHFDFWRRLDHLAPSSRVEQ